MPKRAQNIPDEYTDYERQLARAVGVRVRQRRKHLKLSQAQVRVRMEMVSVSVTYSKFSRIENGSALANIAEIVALAASLDVSYKWLLDGTDEQKV
jgi:transcriptional regulator with XRE-family HTH domain